MKTICSIRGLLLFFSLIAAWPCVFYLMGYLPDFKVNVIILVALSALYLLINQGKTNNIPRQLYTIIVIQIIFCLFYFLFHRDSSYFTRVIYIVAATLIIKVDLVGKHPIFAHIFVYWILIQSVLSLIGFVMCLFGILEPISVFEEMDGRMGYNFGFFTTNVFLGIFVRPSGFFDEAGALACWGIYALVMNRLFVKKSYVEYILLVSLLVTLSLAYFVQAIVFLFFFYRNHIKKLAIISLLLSMLVTWVISQDDALEKATIGRLEYDKGDGTISGDSRAELRKNARTVFLSAPIFGVGARNLMEKIHPKMPLNSNEFTNLASDGIIGFVVTIIPYLYLLFYMGRERKDVKYGVIVCMIGLLQRPFEFTQLIFILVVYSMINNVLIQNSKSKYDFCNNSCI